MDPWRVGARIAKPDIKSLIIRCKRLGASDAVGDPAHGRVQNPMHEKNTVPCICGARKTRMSLFRNLSVSILVTFYHEEGNNNMHEVACTTSQMSMVGTC